MEKIILLTAVCLCGCCVILFFLSVKYTLFRIYAFILWSLSAVMIFSAAAIMIAYQVLSKFEYQYVYSHTGLDTAVIYKVSSLWSGQEGSFLTWALIMSVMSFFLLRIKGKDKYRAFGIYSIICFCIYMICFISRPFAKMSFIPADGMGLNEALKDPWMVVHPPLIFISYSAMAILFSLSANLSKKAVDDIVDRIRFWLRISWFFLGIGILSGSIWAYRTLGWGGYWSWDPIENAAFIPWLVICGYFHRNEYNKQSVCVVPFSIAAFGVFLARSGILKNRSMHAYTDGNLLITVIILCFIIGIALFLVLSERKKKESRTG